MQINRIIRFDPNFLPPSSQCGRLSVVVLSVDRVAAQAGYFENTVSGKITDPWVAVFWSTFIIYRGRPRCM